MKSIYKYIVGTRPRTKVESLPKGFLQCDTSDKSFHTVSVPLYYHKTEEGFGSTYDALRATKFDTWKEANVWKLSKQMTGRTYQIFIIHWGYSE
jgi:hypothetical protein